MKPLRIHYLQHVPFEGLENIENWIRTNKHTLTSTRFFENATLPDIESFDWLIIMGGPMGVYDEKKYHWLTEEKELIKESIIKRKTVVGVCLGAQLIAEALGAKIYPNQFKEIGWFPIDWNFENNNQLLTGFKSPEIVFHWHGDTFDLPERGIRLAHSAACKNQGFLYHNKVLGLQFHLEMNEDSLMNLIENGKHELKNEKYIQSEEKILANKNHIENNKKILFTLLNQLAKMEE